ncbi:5-deoxy-glucuronate isomerase [Burkholderia pseudomallei]|uniref:5-deoxy-glucuronate isomerase n=1 Tax=Burkholderia pseudomallei TaxID=28450 RepID=A0AA40MF49_BURPE|nr:5-deoxy-glucuronate isomerase [Burkholderia pseudomallei]KGS74151.1 5-deoxy-glucuronate isomerase [Burkholderia pseudomallei MSHR5596]KGW80310.1 5-deoxy-glucuronate isomerase [Burkholderia pseudomallei MSHR2990]KGX17204.1 5-deoxy-glucuronate isomerase [Burkholderia pseudomallei]
MSQHFLAVGSAAGLNSLESHSCQHLGFSRLVLGAGETYQGEVPADREMMLVLLSGTARVEVGDTVFERVGKRANVFAGSPHSVYLPRGGRFTVTALTQVDAALPSGPSSLDAAPYEIKPEEVNTGTWGTLNYTRQFREILVQPDGRPASSLIVGETITPSGNWSTYPPHKHEGQSAGEATHEEMYYFRVSTPEGFGIARHYSPERSFDDTHVVRDNTLLSIPYGYHTYAAAPGYTSYYLWFLAGEGRRQGVALDPQHGWAQKVVGML